MTSQHIDTSGRYMKRRLFSPSFMTLKRFVKRNRHLLKGEILHVGAGDCRIANMIGGLKTDLYPNGNGTIKADVQALPFKDGRFGSVVAISLLEHVLNDMKAMSEIKRVLKPGGVLMASIPLCPSAFSKKDIKQGHFRRYGGLGIFSGFRIVKKEYVRLTPHDFWHRPFGIKGVRIIGVKE